MRTLIGRFSFRTLICVAAVFVALAASAIGFTVWQLRSDAIKAAVDDTGNVAAVLADQVDSAVQAVDTALDQIEERMAGLNLRSEDEFRASAKSQYISILLQRYLEILPRDSSVLVIDSGGRGLNGSDQLGATIDYSDRDYYQYFKFFGTERLYISVPSHDRRTGDWTIFFSKRLQGPHQEFYGVAVVGVRASYFRYVYDSVSTLEGRSFVLARADGTILIGQTEPPEAATPSFPLASPWYTIRTLGAGSYRETDQAGVPWLVSVRPVKRFPLFVNVGIAEATALALWRERAFFIGAGSMMALICLGVLFWVLFLQFNRLHRSEAKLAEQSRALELANVKIDGALNNMSQGLSMFDGEGRLILCNELYARMFNLSADFTRPGVRFADLLHHDQMQATGIKGDPEKVLAWIRSEFAAGRSANGMLSLNDGRFISLVCRPMPGGGWVATHEDVTQRRQAESQVAYMARHDMLTGLPNRLLLTEALTRALDRLRGEGERFSVFVFDLDRFKEVNDSRGHPIGDALLKAVAERLRGCTRESQDTVARIGGDEFAILQPADADDQRETAIALATRLQAAISAPYVIGGHNITIGVSIGIAMAPRDGCEAGDLLKHADLALYQVKAAGRDGFALFEPEMDAAHQSLSQMEGDLGQALANRELELFYQPIVSLRQGDICAFEALLRWHHPTRGLVMPGSFIPLAEETGLIVPIGEWAVRQACVDAASWPSHLRLAVNLSPVQLKRGGFIDTVADALAKSGIAPERIELEVTETKLFEDHQDVLSSMHQLRSLGARLVLDDFGTGYASLSNFQDFPYDKIKIDKSFVDHVTTRSQSAAIISSLVGLGRALDIAITAEGVETKDQLALLRAAGCDEVQGYLFGRPKPMKKPLSRVDLASSAA